MKRAATAKLEHHISLHPQRWLVEGVSLLSDLHRRYPAVTFAPLCYHELSFFPAGSCERRLIMDARTMVKRFASLQTVIRTVMYQPFSVLCSPPWNAMVHTGSLATEEECGVDRGCEKKKIVIS